MIETRLHARLAPSAAVRWMTCPGSVRLCESVVDSGSDDANKGTACHAVLERALKEGAIPAKLVGTTIDVGEGDRRAQVEFTEEMAGWVDDVLVWVWCYLTDHPNAHLRSEERLVVGRAFGCPDDLWGTADVVIVSPEELVICDAKFGYNEVAVIDNPQLQLYGIGKAADLGWIHDQYRFVVAQPQCGEPKEHVLTREELLHARDQYAPKVAATFDPEASLVPSDEGCKYCDAAGVCPALQRRAIQLAQREFASVETLSTDELALLIQHADRIKAGLVAAEQHALRLVMLGQKVPGFKAVAGDKRRVWKDEQQAFQTLASLGYDEDEVSPRKMITPAQAEKLVGRRTAKQLAGLIEKPKGEPTLAPESDPRPSLAPDFAPDALEVLDAIFEDASHCRHGVFDGDCPECRIPEDMKVLPERAASVDDLL